MSKTGKRRPPLVADKRPRAAPKPAPKRPRRRKPVRKARRGFVAALFAGLFGWLFRLFWRLAWRGAVVVLLLVAAAVWYYHSLLPPLTDLLDARTRGSVTMMDRNGEVFAWRGEQFGGSITADTVSPHLKNAVIATEDAEGASQ